MHPINLLVWTSLPGTVLRQGSLGTVSWLLLQLWDWRPLLLMLHGVPVGATHVLVESLVQWYGSPITVLQRGRRPHRAYVLDRV